MDKWKEYQERKKKNMLLVACICLPIPDSKLPEKEEWNE